MTRLLLTTLTAALVSAPAFAQGIRDPYPIQVPIPASTVVMPRAGAWSPWQASPWWTAGPTVGPVYLPLAGPAFQTSSSLLFSQKDPLPAVIPLQGAGFVSPTSTSVASIAPSLAATFAVEFPTAAEVWVNGKKQSGRKDKWELTSPALDPGETHTFDVKARWKGDDGEYEWSRTVTLGSGDRGRVNVFSGTKAK